MALSLIDKLKKKMVDWISNEPPRKDFPLCDFERLSYECRPGDVLLIEGRSRVSEVIQVITQSPWSHAMLYIGRMHDIENPLLRERVKKFYDAKPEEQLVIESMLGKGTIVVPLTKYRDAHIRICRPKGIARKDSQHVIGFAIGRLGREYAIRHILDLARFLFPWSIMPRRWRSSLFEHNIGTPTKEICSSMLAEAFNAVQFPILPYVKSHKEKGVQLYQRNPKLFTPSDFDYSPYFEIIKYPIFELSEPAVYRNLPWNEEGILTNDGEEIPDNEQVIDNDGSEEPSSEGESGSSDDTRDTQRFNGFQTKNNIQA